MEKHNIRSSRKKVVLERALKSYQKVRKNRQLKILRFAH